MARHQGHRRILLAFIIVIAMSTSAVQYYHLRRCLRSTLSFSPFTSIFSLPRPIYAVPRVDRFVRVFPRLSVLLSFRIPPSSLMSRDSNFDSLAIIFRNNLYHGLFILLPRNCENSEFFDKEQSTTSE